MVYWHQINKETRAEYQIVKANLEAQGFKILSVVIDGKKGVHKLFPEIPVQMCHFHQKQIIKRYLTLNPRLEAGRELKRIVAVLTLSSEQVFEKLLADWHNKWSNFLKEKTICSETNKFNYTHHRLRSAYRSLRTNFPLLFTYKNHPELKIPNTTNSLEGSFSFLKDLLHTHRGISGDLRLKIINEIFSK